MNSLPLIFHNFSVCRASLHKAISRQPRSRLSHTPETHGIVAWTKVHDNAFSTWTLRNLGFSLSLSIYLSSWRSHFHKWTLRTIHNAGETLSGSLFHIQWTLYLFSAQASNVKGTLFRPMEIMEGGPENESLTAAAATLGVRDQLMNSCSRLHYNRRGNGPESLALTDLKHVSTSFTCHWQLLPRSQLQMTSLCNRSSTSSNLTPSLTAATAVSASVELWVGHFWAASSVFSFSEKASPSGMGTMRRHKSCKWRGSLESVSNPSPALKYSKTQFLSLLAIAIAEKDVLASAQVVEAETNILGVPPWEGDCWFGSSAFSSSEKASPSGTLVLWHLGHHPWLRESMQLAWRQ